MLLVKVEDDRGRDVYLNFGAGNLSRAESRDNGMLFVILQQPAGSKGMFNIMAKDTQKVVDILEAQLQKQSGDDNVLDNSLNKTIDVLKERNEKLSAELDEALEEKKEAEALKDRALHELKNVRTTQGSSTDKAKSIKK